MQPVQVPLRQRQGRPAGQPFDSAGRGVDVILDCIGGAYLAIVGGTSALETFFTKREQYHSFIINAKVSALQAATQERLSGMQQYFMAHGTPDAAGAMHRAMVAIGQTINAQATIMGYADCFALLGGVLLCAIFAVAMLKKGAAAAGGAH